MTLLIPSPPIPTDSFLFLFLTHVKPYFILIPLPLFIPIPFFSHFHTIIGKQKTNRMLLFIPKTKSQSRTPSHSQRAIHISVKTIVAIHIPMGPVWRFGAVGSDVGRINEVTLRRARLVLGWVTVSGFNSRCGKFISV